MSGYVRSLAIQIWFENLKTLGMLHQDIPMEPESQEPNTQLIAF